MSKNLNSSVYIAWWVWIVEAIGDWNPQLLRELKSRVNWRNSIVTGLLSIGLQASFLAYRSTLLPIDRVTDDTVYPQYCQIDLAFRCAADALGNPIIDWAQWWAHVAMGSGLIFVLMATVGAYFVAGSFRQERELGTLDFLRLVPRSSATVLVGKLLGVPVLVYLAAICALPLQLYAVCAADLSTLTLLTWDLAMVGLTIMCYLSATLVTLRSNALPILSAIVTFISSGVLVAISLRWYGKYDNFTLQWYGIRLDNQLQTFLVLIALTGLGCYWLYRAVERSYQQPNRPILSRTQSYLWSLTYHLFLLGFCVIHKLPDEYFFKDTSHSQFTPRLAFDLSLNAYSGGTSSDGFSGNLPPMFWSLLLFWLLLTISLMLPNVRAMTEWAQEQDFKPDWWKTMLWDDRSPAILAALVNIGIAIAVWSIPISIAFPISRSSIFTYPLAAIVALIFTGIWSTIVHFRLFGRVSKYRLFLVGVASIFILPVYIWETNARGKHFGEWFGLFPSTFGKMLLLTIESNPWGSIIVILGMLWIWSWLLLCLQTKLAQIERI